MKGVSLAKEFTHVPYSFVFTSALIVRIRSGREEVPRTPLGRGEVPSSERLLNHTLDGRFERQSCSLLESNNNETTGGQRGFTGTRRISGEGGRTLNALSPALGIE